MPEPLTIRATDDFPLAATMHGGGDAAVLLIAPATGVKRRLYDAFARFAASQGMTVISWDWRGTGDSRPPSLRGFAATMQDWGARDLAGVIDWVSRRFPHARLLGMGHSFGGMSYGLAPNSARVTRLLAVASQSGYVGHWPPALRARYTLLWYAALPAITHAVGYFPASRFGFGEDLPRGVALQWARWCRRREYVGDWGGHALFTAPLLAMSFTDDPYAPTRAAAALVERFGSAEREHRVIDPAGVGVARIGHFGFFREGLVPALWAESVAWLGAA